MALLKSGKKLKINNHKMSLFCKGQKTPSKKYEDNYSKIFGKEDFKRNLKK